VIVRTRRLAPRKAVMAISLPSGDHVGALLVQSHRHS
jgi:hypothetical protein